MNPHRFTGTTFIIIFLLSFLAPTVTNGQCYQIARSSGIKALDAKKYDEAIKKFEAAKQCSDVPADNDLDIFIENAMDKKRRAEAEKATRKPTTTEKRTTTPPRKEEIKVIIPPEVEAARRPIEPEMIFVQGGTFFMGANDDVKSMPVHLVTINDFYIGKYEVTFEEYDAFCNATGRKKSHDNDWGRGKRPVIAVSWEDAIAYCKWLSKQTGKNYRLPTEAEWEYAARGGMKSKGFKFAGSNNLDAIAWFYNNSGGKTQPVGQKQANELGIYDMTGNVWEWIQDCWHDNYVGAPTNGTEWISSWCNQRGLRGGSWHNNTDYNFFNFWVTTRHSCPQNNIFSNQGFRIVRSN